MDFLLDSFYLNELEVIKLKKDSSLYLFCGYEKDSSLNRANSVTNYAYDSEIYLLGRTILPEYKNIGLFDLLGGYILGGNGMFVSLNEDGRLDGESKYKVLSFEKDSFEKIGNMTEEDISLWQNKRKLLDKSRPILNFFTRDDAIDGILNDKTYEISAEKDEIFLNKFYDIFENDCRKLDLDASYYIQYTKTDKTDSNKYPFAYGYTIERLDDTLCFYKVPKYSGRREQYGKCSVFDKREVVNLFLARNVGRETFFNVKLGEEIC